VRLTCEIKEKHNLEKAIRKTKIETAKNITKKTSEILNEIAFVAAKGTGQSLRSQSKVRKLIMYDHHSFVKDSSVRRKVPDYIIRCEMLVLTLREMIKEFGGGVQVEKKKKEKMY